ncbi:MAG: endolytic transglycosylase MltG [Patescibacteria group bacterium]
MKFRFHFKVVFIILFTTLIGFSVAFTLSNKSTMKFVADVIDNFSHPEFYEALANPTVRYVKVAEGLRKEEIESALDDKFAWDATDTADFLGHDEFRQNKFEGKYYPDVYLIPRDASGAEVKQMMNERFAKNYAEVKSGISTSTISTDRVLAIASIIQREAAGKSDMNLIAGIIWNRLFAGMPLQMDATLQYVKGVEGDWWPDVLSKDKKLDSPYNTYQNKGLPPSPIANPGLAAITAALNPQKTDCIYYLHSKGQIYCSKTYAEHLKNIEKYLK